MDSEASGTMEVAALGRPFSPGMLYDCRKDSLVPGMTLWDRDDLRNHIGERPQSYNDFEIVASESIADKSSALNVEASLKASFLSGLVEVGGSAKYLSDSKTSKNQARVTLMYKATTKVQELSMNHLGRDNVKHPYVFDKGLATHVVTAILYGAQAFFVFDREVSEKEDHQDIEGNLKVMIKKIPKIAIEGEGSLKMKDKDRENVEKFSCRFFGDFSLQKPPTSFQDAVEVYQSLPKLLGANGENAVPVKVWLLPLTSLDSSAAKLVRQISIRLVHESQSVLEDFSELEMRCSDALRTTTAQQFSQISKKIKTFKEMCSEFKLEFQRTLAKKLPSIRGGGEEEAELAEILKKRHSSPFNSKELNEWMDCKEREICILKSFTNMMKNTKIVPSQNHLYNEIHSAEHAVCFVFTSLGSAEPFLSALSNYLTETPKPDEPRDAHTDDVEREQWYTSKEVLATMSHKAKLFSDFAEANKENKNIKFLTVGSTNETHKGSSIYLYEDGFSVSENFEPPSKPETVTVTETNHNSVTLKISPPKFGAENITSYSVEYCVSGDDGWKQKTASEAEEVTVSDLSPNTEYMFRCRAVTSAGVGPANEIMSHNDPLLSMGATGSDLFSEHDWIKLEPEVNCVDADDAPAYSLQSEAGAFECSVSGLRWVCKEKVSFKYQFGSWKEHADRLETMQYIPGGPLLDITVIAGKLDEAHLPHWICTEDNPTVLDKFAVLHIDTCGDIVEQVSEVTSSHVKLSQPAFSPRGVLMRAGFPVRINCKVLIYKTTKTFLTLHVYVIPCDPALEEKIQNKELSSGYKMIQKPYPAKYLKMRGYFILTADMDAAEINPEKLKLIYEWCDPNFFEVFIDDPDSNFQLGLRHTTSEQVWTSAIRKNDYQNTGDVQVMYDKELARLRPKLVGRVCRELINQLLDDLLEGGVLNDGEKDSILQENSTSANRARRLIDMIRKKGREASRKLLTHLQSRDPTLCAELGLPSGLPV
ncbi:cytolytic toxin-alpha-like [Epinephelus moara]|uniref:cytolytic toxin-alpha-like n=1 Tax=Epinephelus moara TaxID=300413 RepID=UPI00214ECE28|nr:cytolytic toxin-alpha-like [Epinephelus moara]XP_049930411.1 cytolytic toxin-alpha-like [Epinephelus moara]XP_049930412.1 cytolytic toxin-alpha-like [Epinephelus moara]XP_049930413.1 cytolytic toxin-alpha-like [Epinephelus moara]